jgi:uncharacterized protein
MEHDTIALFLTFLVTGLTVGFGHCIGMCGPIVVSFSLSLPGRRPLVPHLLYHCGRILTYMILGGIMGATGSFAIVAANIAILQRGAMFFTGALIVVMGLSMCGWIAHVDIFKLNGSPGGAIVKTFARLSKRKSMTAYLPIGLVLGLLPCGPVYTALLAVARAGMAAPSIYRSIFLGMALMLAFGLGTLPALFLVARLTDMGWLRFRDKIYKLGALLMIGVGIYFIVAAIRY